MTKNYLVCLEDGTTHGALEDYLQSHYNLTPEAYRARWNLPASYPMSVGEYLAPLKKEAPGAASPAQPDVVADAPATSVVQPSLEVRSKGGIAKTRSRARLKEAAVEESAKETVAESKAQEDPRKRHRLSPRDGALTPVPKGRTDQKPAVDPRKSVTYTCIFCLEDATPHRMLKRYIRRSFGLTPEEYRERWGLPPDYPMNCPEYDKTCREHLAKLSRLRVERARVRTH